MVFKQQKLLEGEGQFWPLKCVC